MTGSTALDIFIGLIFIYLTYSLLTTVIVESIATKIGLRARNLQQAIVRMLSDKEIKGLDGLKRLRNSEEGLEENSLAKEFYNAPGIKYLAANNHYKKPSSFSGELFSQNLIYILSNKGTGDNIFDKITNSLNLQTNNSNNETLEYLRFLLEESNGDLEKLKAKLIHWFDETMERATGWYKKKIQVWLFWFGLLIAMIFNVDTFQIVEKLSVDKKARDQFVQLADNLQGTDYDELKKSSLNELKNQAFETQAILSLKREKYTCLGPYFFNSLPNLIGCLIT